MRLFKFDSFTVDVGKWNGYILVYRFSWKSEQIKYLPFRPSYKKKKARGYFSCTEALLIPLKSETLSHLQSLLYLLITP